MKSCFLTKMLCGGGFIVNWAHWQALVIFNDFHQKLGKFAYECRLCSTSVASRSIHVLFWKPFRKNVCQRSHVLESSGKASSSHLQVTPVTDRVAYLLCTQLRGLNGKATLMFTLAFHTYRRRCFNVSVLPVKALAATRRWKSSNDWCMTRWGDKSSVKEENLTWKLMTRIKLMAL